MAAIALLGDINIDLLLEIPAYPAEGGEAIASAQTTSLGGSATNTAITLARLGFETRLLGRVGDDLWGQRALADLSAAGVRTDWITRDPAEPTQINLVMVAGSGERTMFAYRGANAQLGPDQVVPSLFENVALLHLSGYSFLCSPQADAARLAIEMAGSRAIPVTLDIPAGVVGQIAASVLPLLDCIDTILLGEADLDGLGVTAPALLQRGVRRVALKRGAAGSVLYEAGGETAVDGFTAPAVDTTGAGDAFAAGQIAGLLGGLDGHACCRLANALGAAAVTRRGAGLAMPGPQDIDAFLGPGSSRLVKA